MTERRPEEGEAFRRILTRNLIVPLAMGLGSIVVFVGLLWHLMGLLGWVDHTHRVVAKAHELATLSVDSESGLRGFLLSGQDAFLAPYGVSQAKLAGELRDAELLVGDNPAQVDRLRRVASLSQRWTLFAENLIDLRRRGEPVEAAIRTQAGKQLMDEMRRELRAFGEAEARLLRDRNEDAQVGTWVSVGGYIAVLLLASGLIAWAGRRDIQALSLNYSGALDDLAATARDSEERAWLRGAQADLSALLMGERRVAGLGERTLGFLAERVQALVSAAFVRGDNGTLQCVAAQGLNAAEAGERDAEAGLLGQVWRSGRLMRVPALADDFLKVHTSLGDMPPREVLLVPALYEGRVNAVLELGFVDEPSPRALALVEPLQTLLGALVEAALARQRLQDSVEETRQLNEELQVQQEELRSANEELGEQSRVLSESQLHLETQRAELEQTNLRLAEQAHTLAARNAALAQAQAELEDRAQQLQRASKYKSEFLANMSHELRTPLNSALILSGLLAENKPGNLTDEQRRFASTIYAAGQDLLLLINDILDLSKVEAGKLDITPAPLHLATLAENLRQLFGPQAQQKHLNLAIDLAPGLPDSLMTDGQRVEQILRNLLSNALKFTERGTVGLRIEPRREGVAFLASDTGIGIAPALQQRVFEAFHQGDGALNRRFGGTGLGLSISRQLASLLGGELTLSSVEGQGSQFTLLLPWAPPLPAAPRREVVLGLAVPAPAAFLALPAPVAPPTRPPRPSVPDDRAELQPGAAPRRLALVVEDDPAFAGILYDTAHELNYRCLVAGEAGEALALASQHLPHAIMLDVRLPDGSGLEVLQRLKEDPRTRHIPVHIIAGEDFRHVALPMGAVGTAIKPTTRDELLRIFQTLERHGGDRPRRLLLVEDDARQRESIAHLIADDAVEVVAVAQGQQALTLLDEQPFDCMVIDLKLPDMDGSELLARMAARGLEKTPPPVIVYTGRQLSREEEAELNRYSRSIIIKGARSPERLLDEVTLFLHTQESRLSGERQDLLRTARNRERVFEGRKVLLVDDDARNIFALTSVLEQRGLTVEPARNGAEALERLAAQDDIDLVLMDVMMPVMDGLEATRRIREQARWRKLPVIAVTAKAMRDDQEQCRRAGANDYLAKPIDVDRLVSLLRVWLPELGRADLGRD
ncbi:response regulator [Pelomonas baiyunensis]|uniref:histidine kinase n=1 Tax=Pelomonas baiyunensis TaxID=3299026 RepID=A0ABW7GY50_9BURK